MSSLSIDQFSGVQTFERFFSYSKEGYFSNIYQYENFPHKFVQDSVSFVKKKNTIKGMHFQIGKYSQAKLITCLQGSIADFFIDLRKTSKTFGSYGTVIIDSKNPISLFLPRGFAHGYQTLTQNTLISYKLDNFYFPEAEKTLAWDDKDIDITWKNTNHLFVCEKDLKGITFQSILRDI